MTTYSLLPEDQAGSQDDPAQWNDPNNWVDANNQHGVPGAGDVVNGGFIGGLYVTGGGSAASFGGLYLEGGAYNFGTFINGGIYGGTTVSADTVDTVWLYGGTLTAGTLGTDLVEQGTLLIQSGTATISGGGSILGFSQMFNGQLTVGGTTTIDGEFEMTGGNASFSTLAVSSPDPYPDNSYFEFSGGTVSVSGSTTASNGVIEVYGGSLTMGDVALSTGSQFFVAAGIPNETESATVASLSADDSQVYVESGGALTVSGSLTLSNGSSMGVGGPDTTTIGGNLLVAQDGQASFQVAEGGTVTVGGDLQAAVDAGSTATLTISDAGAALTIDGDWQIGVAGTATATVNGGVGVSVGGTIELGVETTGNGTVTLSDSGTVLTGGIGDVTIGEAGTGTLTVENGASFDAAASAVTVGDEATALGTLTITGADSQMETGDLTIAGASASNNGASSQATVAQGGALTVDGDLIVADEQGSKGALLLTDAGSSLDVGGNATIGGSGTGRLAIDGAAATIGGSALVLGDEHGSAGKLTLAGGSLDFAGDTTIGGQGSGQMIIELGGAFGPGSLAVPAGTTDTVTLGGAPSGKGTLTVNGGSLTSFGLVVGSAGSGNLQISNGGTVDTTGSASIGEQTAAVVQKATVSSLGSWSIAGDLSIGEFGIAQVTVQSGGTIDASNVTLGENKSASGSLAVTGTQSVGNNGVVASELLWGGTLIVGDGGVGTLTVSSGAVVEPGGGGSGILEIAAESGSTGEVAVSGAGSELLGSKLAVGGDFVPGGGKGTLTVSDGGTTSFDMAVIETSGRMSISSATGSFGSLIDNGTMTVSEGSAVTIAGALSGSGKNLIEGGTLTIDGGVAANETIDFADDAGKLVLGHAATFAATVAGFAQGDAIDLATFASATSTIAGVTGTGAKGTDTVVTIDDGALTAQLSLLNQYANEFAASSSAYQLASDQSGPHPGTLFELAAPRV